MLTLKPFLFDKSTRNIQKTLFTISRSALIFLSSGNSARPCKSHKISPLMSKHSRNNGVFFQASPIIFENFLVQISLLIKFLFFASA
ncbi:hypothetical protein EO93_09355 [Methanosarcina sp. 1.H.A.2.2]|nr:hypothetical protein EO93_09355 [Methanosarcina sp. 1.H.A.2.2]